MDGTRRVIEALDDAIDWCVVGEPSSADRVGDTIKHGRRGLAQRPAHRARGAGAHRVPGPRGEPHSRRLRGARGARGRSPGTREARTFPRPDSRYPTCRAGTGAVNVIPGSFEALFNLRYSPALRHTEIVERVESVLERHGLRREIEWQHSAAPFLTRGGRLVDAARSAVREVAGIEPRALDGRRHLGRTFHRAHRGGGTRARPRQCHHPPGRRARELRGSRPAEPDVRGDPSSGSSVPTPKLT